MVLDLSGFSYKMPIPDLCSNVRARYMAVANRFVLSGDYSQKRNKYLLRVSIVSLILILIDVFVVKAGLLNAASQSGDAFIFSLIIAFVITPIVIIGIILWQGAVFSKEIKQCCVKAILQDLIDIDVLANKGGTIEQNYIYDQDLSDLGLYFTSRHMDDNFVGKYKNAEYALNELKLYRGYGKHRRMVFEGFVLKADINTKIDGWVELFSKSLNRPVIITFILIAIAILLIFGQSIEPILHIKSEYLLILVSIIGVVYAIINALGNAARRGVLLTQQYTQGNLAQIKANYEIRTSSGMRDLNKVITSELADVMGKLQYLFNTDKIQCRFYDNNVILAVNSRKNLFEIGGLFRKPTNPKVAEDFIAQFTGIVIFMDYLTSVYNDAK